MVPYETALPGSRSTHLVRSHRILGVTRVPPDFGGGLHNMDYLKTLPISAGAICAGQLVTPVLLILL